MNDAETYNAHRTVLGRRKFWLIVGILALVLYFFSYPFVLPLAEKFPPVGKCTYFIYEPVELLRSHFDSFWFLTEKGYQSVAIAIGTAPTPPQERYFFPLERKYLIYRNGVKIRETCYRYGKEDGIELYWYDDGVLREQNHYSGGKKDGLCLEWHSNGKKALETPYASGVIHGTCISYYPNGQKEFEIDYGNGVMNGKEKVWNKQGEIILLKNHRDGNTEDIGSGSVK